MNFLSHALHGSTAFVSILIGQVLVVSSLSLMAIWLLVRRARYAGSQDAGAPLNTAYSSAGAPTVSVTASPEYLELEKQLVSAREEHQKLATMKDQYTALEEKVKFLESKLLEYEILQEEIGTLSLLKIENEKLKKEISKLQKEIERRVGGGKGAAEEESDAPPISEAEEPLSAAQTAPTNAEETMQPSSETSAGLEPTITAAAISDEISAEELANLATVTFTPETTAPTSVRENSAMTPAQNPDAYADAGGGLDGLLSEIDKLTSDDTPPKT